MKKFNAIMDQTMRFLMSVAMFSILVGGIWQIFTRWILGDPSTFTDEFLRYVLIWAGMIGSAYCFYTDQHLSLDIMKRRVHGKAAIALNVFIEICVLFFVGYIFVFGGFRLTMNATNISSVMHIPYRFLYSILPISGVFIILARMLKYVQLYLDHKNAKKGDTV